MYEMRQKQRKEMQQKRWFNYALLATAIFLFTQGSSVITTNTGYAIAAILLSFLLHVRSVVNLTERVLKIKSSNVANIAMLVSLSAISIICYFSKLNIIFISLLNFAAIAIYVIVAAISSKFKTGEN